MTLSRRLLIKLVVDWSWGLPAGYTWASATAGWPGPAGKNSGPTAVTTSGGWLAAVTTAPKGGVAGRRDHGTEGRLVGLAGQRRHELERAAEAGPEPVHEHLVAPVGGGRGAGGVHTVVGGALPHRQERRAERHHDAEGGDAEDEPPALDERRPAGPAAGRLVEGGLTAGQSAALPAGEDATPGQAGQRGQQGQRPEENEGDGDRCRDRRARQ